MKTLSKTTLLFCAIFMFLSIHIVAQNGSSQAYWIHEDFVKPSKVDQYEKTTKDLVANLKKFNIKDESWITSVTDDYRYLYIGPISKMADLDRPVFGTLADKMGAEKLGHLFDEMNECYDKHVDYVIHLDKNLTYMPNGITQTPVGENYRKLHYLHFTPENADKVKSKLEEIKELFKRKGSKVHYRVYRSGFGAQGDFYIVAIAAENSVDYATKSAENKALLGEEGERVFNELIETLLKYESTPGQMREDLAYSSKN